MQNSQSLQLAKQLLDKKKGLRLIDRYIQNWKEN